MLGKIAQIYDGPHATPEKTGDGPWYLSISSLVDGRLDLSQSAHVSEEDFRIWTKRVKPEAGDVVFSYETRLGEAALVPDGLRCALGRRMGLLRPDTSRVDSQFLVYAYLGPEFQNTIHTRISHGSTVNRILLTELRDYPIRLPPLPEQRKIAEILGTWDEAIALTERRIKAARQRKKGMMQRLLTGRVRFPEFEGEEWQTVKLGEVFDERKERGYGDLPLLSVTAEAGIVYRDELDRRDTSSSDKSNYLRVCEGDVAYNTMRMWQGRSGVSEYEGIVSPAYTVCEPAPEIDVDFVGYLFQLPSIIYRFRRYSQGMVSDTWTLRYDSFAAIAVQIPSLDEQKRIADVLQTCDREIELLEQKRDALQRQKKGLMQRLLTGRVRV